MKTLKTVIKKAIVENSKGKIVKSKKNWLVRKELDEKNEIKKAIREAFKDFRKDGMFARMNYWCCQSCGFYAARQEVDKKAQLGKPYTGIVFYHGQDAKDLADGDDFMLAYDTALDQNAEDEDVVEVGKRIVSILKNNLLQVDWDEDPAHRICVQISKGLMQSVNLLELGVGL